MQREDLSGYIEELNKRDDVSIDEICELAHAWGYDQVSDLEAYLFLKKSNAALDRSITVDDMETYLQFEAKYSANKPGINIITLFSILFPEQKKISLKDFLYLIYSLIIITSQ